MILRSDLATFVLEVYLHSGANYNETSSHLADFMTAIGAKSRRLEATGRRLQTLDNGVSTKRYECDDTLFQCEPVCVETVTKDRLLVVSVFQINIGVSTPKSMFLP